jgi:hypothetical protein
VIPFPAGSDPSRQPSSDNGINYRSGEAQCRQRIGGYSPRDIGLRVHPAKYEIGNYHEHTDRHPSAQNSHDASDHMSSSILRDTFFLKKIGNPEEKSTSIMPRCSDEGRMVGAWKTEYAGKFWFLAGTCDILRGPGPTDFIWRLNTARLAEPHGIPTAFQSVPNGIGRITTDKPY